MPVCTIPNIRIKIIEIEFTSAKSIWSLIKTYGKSTNADTINWTSVVSKPDRFFINLFIKITLAYSIAAKRPYSIPTGWLYKLPVLMSLSPILITKNNPIIAVIIQPTFTGVSFSLRAKGAKIIT